MSPRAFAIVVALAAASTGALVEAQIGPPAGPPQPKLSAWGGQAIDLTGYWVSIVNEDWRWRMMAAPKGDFPGLPVNPAGRKIAETWDPSQDGRCEAFGAAALLRMPTRVRITWDGDSVLKLETDAGQQTRRLSFDKAARPPAAPSLQGHSIAEWVRPFGPFDQFAAFFGAVGPPRPGGSLKVVTTRLRSGWLRRNGVPYSEGAVVTEYFDRFPGPDDSEWFVVTTTVDDPVYLTRPFVTSSHFRREPDGSRWSPTRCRTT